MHGRSRSRQTLSPTKLTASTTGFAGGLFGSVAGAYAASSIGSASAAVTAAATLSVMASVSLGSAAAAVVIAIPILHVLKRDALVLSKTRKLHFNLQPSDKAPNGFTLKTRITRSNNHGGNFVHPKGEKGRIHLQQDTGALFIATRTSRGNIYLQVVDSKSPKWLVARFKKVKLDSTRKTAWQLTKVTDQSSSASTDGSSIED